MEQKQKRQTVPVFDSQDELMKSVDVLKAGLVRHREDDEEAVPRPHVLLPHRAELLLAGCVQHCKDGHKTVAGVKEFRAVCSHLQLHIAAVLRSKSSVVLDVSFFLRLLYCWVQQVSTKLCVSLWSTRRPIVQRC